MAVQPGQTFPRPPPPPARKPGGAGRLLPSWRTILNVPADEPALAASQLMALSYRAPMLYLTIIVNVLGLTITHAAIAPPLLGLVLPGGIILISLLRLIGWHRRQRPGVHDEAGILHQLHIARLVVVGLGSCTGAWALSLLPYGNAYQQSQVELGIALTLISCIVCLIYLHSAAIMLGIIVGLPFAIVFLRSPHLPVVITAITALVAMITMTLVLLRNASDFNALSRSRNELKRRQQETQRLSDENLRLANLDPLTGLPNRRSFFATLEQDRRQAEQHGQNLAVVLLDLDRFKSVNDIHGHAAGDRLLTQIAVRLKRLVSETVFIARLGGDEFGAVLTDCPHETAIFAFGAAIQQQLAGPCIVGDRLATIGCSIGVAIYPHAGGSAEELFERADYALHHGKQTRRGEVVLFSDEHEIRIRQTAHAEEALRTADLEAEMWIAFQPIVDVPAGRVIAFEALARWHSRELGPVRPDIFIPLAERTQMIGPLTCVLLRKALAAARQWPDGTNLCFNLSGQTLGCIQTMDKIRQLVRESGVPAARIEFEITETALLEDFDLAMEALRALRALGARIALDDFGTGFSSLGYVHRLTLDKIKIDKSFIGDIDVSSTASSIVKTIVALCHNLNLACVVEGVETEAQLRALLALGCRYIQGYFISPPVPEEMVSRLMARIASQAADIKSFAHTG